MRIPHENVHSVGVPELSSVAMQRSIGVALNRGLRAQ